MMTVRSFREEWCVTKCALKDLISVPAISAPSTFTGCRGGGSAGWGLAWDVRSRWPAWRSGRRPSGSRSHDAIWNKKVSMSLTCVKNDNHLELMMSCITWRGSTEVTISVGMIRMVAAGARGSRGVCVGAGDVCLDITQFL